MIPPKIAIALAVALILALAVIGYRIWKKSRVSPEERERRRRAGLVAHGKLGDANLVEIQDGLLFYSYLVRGVEYTASQDVSLLTSLLPADMSSIAAVGVKYDPRIPANSIVLAEDWSGLRLGKTGSLATMRRLK